MVRQPQRVAQLVHPGMAGAMTRVMEEFVALMSEILGEEPDRAEWGSLEASNVTRAGFPGHRLVTGKRVRQ